MAGTVFPGHNTRWLGKSIGANRKSWACASLIALGCWLGLAADVHAEPPGLLPPGQMAVDEPAPLLSTTVAPTPISQSPVSNDRQYLFRLNERRGLAATTPDEPRPIAGVDDRPMQFIDGQQQAVPQLNQQMMLDDGTNVQLFATPNPDAPLVGAAAYQRRNVGFVRELNAGASANQEQFVYHGGLTFAILEREGFGMGGRVLFGGADYDDLADRQFSYSGDLFAGFRMQTRYGEHWFKGGAFYDWQDHFYKSGPAFAALLFANEAHPMTLDVALGFGGGEDINFAPARVAILEVADRDFQVRAGFFANSNLQLGFSGNYVQFDSVEEYRAYWGVGGFANLMLGNIRLNLDLTVGEGGVRGFANAAWVFGGAGVPACPVGIDGQAWLMGPVNRDVALRVRTKGIPLTGVVGNIGLVTGTVIFPPRLAMGGDQNGNGIIEPGDTFELNLTVTNTSVLTAANVSVGQNPVIIGAGATLENTISGAALGDIPPGESRSTDQFSDFDIMINPGATNGQQFFVEFDLTSDGRTSRVRLGPFTVGSITNGQTASVSAN